jgi:hypothetical protein
MLEVHNNKERNMEAKYLTLIASNCNIITILVNAF